MNPIKFRELSSGILIFSITEKKETVVFATFFTVLKIRENIKIKLNQFFYIEYNSLSTKIAPTVHFKHRY